MANPSLQIGNSNWAIKEDNLLGYSTAGTRFVPQPITMTRESAGTRVNSSGLVETVELLGSNVVINGDFATDSNWTKGTGWTISSGSANCDGSQTGTTSLTPLLDNVVNNVTYIVEYTISNYSSGSISIKLGNTGYGAVRNANGTYREEIKALATTFPRTQFNADSSFDGSIDNVSVKESTKNNLARVDYDGTASSLLVEPERINLVTESEDFSAWSSSNSTLANSTTVVNPSGESSSGLFSLTSGSATKFSYISVTTTSNLHSYSIFVKYSDVQFIQLAGGGNTSYANFDVQNGVLGNTNANSSIESFGNGWYKCIMTSTSSETFSNAAVVIIDALTSARLSSTSEVGSVYIWGGQLEVGSYATSYIPTDGGTVTRVQDQYSKTGISNLINSEEGCVFGEGNFAESNSGGSYVYFASLSDGTVNNRLEIRQTSSNVQFLWRVSTYQSQIATSGVDVGSNFKFAVSYSSANIKFYVNGNPIGTINTPTLWSANTLNRMAFDDGAGGNRLSGKVKQLQVFKTALTDSELIALTT